MTTSFPIHHGGRRSKPVDATTSYVVAFEARLRLLLLVKGNYRHLDDVVSAEKTRLFEHLAEKMAAYPNPEVYAAVRAQGGRANIEYDRNQNAQRGAGARGARPVCGADAVSEADFLKVEKREARWDIADEVVDQLLASALVGAAFDKLGADQKRVLMYVDGHGYTVTEAGKELGMARETASRKYHAAHKAIGGRPPC